MSRRLLLLGLLFAAFQAPARDNPENWLQVTSPHFVVVTDGSEKQARHTADQFERMRAVFHSAFPDMQVDSGPPILVLATKNEKDFRALEPEAYLGKGKLSLAGLFLRTSEGNFVLLRLDAGGDHPYAVVYHEYTHFMSSRAAAWLPLWLNEGLAEFYQNTDIRDKEVLVGEPSDANLLLLRQTPSLPLATLFAVDHNSPYYHEGSKGSIFYAESWALTHFLMIGDARNHTHRMIDYAALVRQGMDPVSAATRAFGDLKQLQADLDNYIRQALFQAFRMANTTEIDDSAFRLQPVSPPDADVVRANFLAHNGRADEAKSLLQQVLHDHPDSPAAHAAMGFLAFRQGNLEEARASYGQAVALNSQDYLAHYYFAVFSMSGNLSEADQARVESSLRTAIKLNPSFAPAYDRLAIFLEIRQKSLDEAHLLEVQAVELDPGNLQYRLNTSSILLSMRQAKAAVAVLQTALGLFKSPQEIATIQGRLEEAQKYQAAWHAWDEEKVEQSSPGAGGLAKAAQGPASSPPGGAASSDTGPPVLAHASQGGIIALFGTITRVRCGIPSVLDFTLNAAGRLVALHSGNFRNVAFTAVGFTPAGELKPCSQLEGFDAKVEYVPGVGGSAGQLLSVELHK